jgi:hypothetical protein
MLHPGHKIYLEARGIKAATLKGGSAILKIEGLQVLNEGSSRRLEGIQLARSGLFVVLASGDGL